MKPPPALRSGDVVGVFAPSSRAARQFHDRFQRGLHALEIGLGVHVRLPSFLEADSVTAYIAGSTKDRASAFMELAADPEVRAIFTTIGGFNTNDILPLLEKDILSSDPKIVVGYSDTTALLLAYQSITRHVVFYGPAVLPQFGEYPRPLDRTVSSLKDMLMHGRGEVLLPNAEEVAEWRDWALPPVQRQVRTAPPPLAIRNGEGSGRLFGGNLSTLNFLVGTPFFAPPDGDLVFFFEATGQEAQPALLRRALTQLQQVGLFRRIRAMLVGRSPDTGRTEEMRALLLELFRDYHTFPIAIDLPFGHIDPMATLPVGVGADVHCHTDAVHVRFQTPAVAL